VLPALDLLPHSVRTAPRDVRTLVSGPSPDAVLVDARSELSEARATCRMLHATGIGVPPWSRNATCRSRHCQAIKLLLSSLLDSRFIPCL